MLSFVQFVQPKEDLRGRGGDDHLHQPAQRHSGASAAASASVEIQAFASCEECKLFLITGFGILRFVPRLNLVRLKGQSFKRVHD
jgi:hypothetical protein